ncbi:hypothetical protein C8R45DRAFT_1042680 [Mycena sanguinolenta]|nr:hypothetical protein C8R45DRAFT_1042680 [Mycena sanguinolenta]
MASFAASGDRLSWPRLSLYPSGVCLSVFTLFLLRLLCASSHLIDPCASQISLLCHPASSRIRILILHLNRSMFRSSQPHSFASATASSTSVSRRPRTSTSASGAPTRCRSAHPNQVMDARDAFLGTSLHGRNAPLSRAFENALPRDECWLRGSFIQGDLLKVLQR